MGIKPTKGLTAYIPVPLLLISLLTNHSWAGQLLLSADKTLSQDGSFNLSWNGQKTKPVEIQAGNSSFSQSKTIYHGFDKASVITGKPDGDYFYRGRIRLGRLQFSPWSQTIKITVQHHSLQRAWLFFSLGALVFVATTLLIFFGSIKNNTKKENS